MTIIGALAKNGDLNNAALGVSWRARLMLDALPTVGRISVQLWLGLSRMARSSELKLSRMWALR